MGGDGERVTATVKWFNPTKGFGFVAPVDGSPDAFLHMSALRSLGVTSVPQGATVVCEIRQGQKGPQVFQVMNIDTSTATEAPRAPRSFGGPRMGGGGGFGGGGFGGPRGGGGGAPMGPPPSPNELVA
ncbi:MAG: cold shock domain-containing protein, partial [Alphaproteobacteria bacterium]|nr:cold shock domain-containing protein [Alphaproteobacteria bacterium]